MLEDRYLTRYLTRIWLDAIFTAGDSVEVDFVLFSEKSLSGVPLQTCFFTSTGHLPHVASLVASESLHSTISSAMKITPLQFTKVWFMRVSKMAWEVQRSSSGIGNAHMVN